jgi:hypothetical protein
MSEFTQAIHTYLTTSTGSNFLNRAVTMVADWEGAGNLLWRVECGGQEAVVKYYLDAGQARGRRQFDGQERFSPLGLAPKPLWFDRYPTGLSRQVLVYQWVPGAVLDGQNAGQLLRLAQAVAQVHSGDPEEVRRFSPNPVNLDYLWKILHGGLPQLQQWLPAQGAHHLARLLASLTANAAALVEAALPLWHGVAPSPIHGDLKLENAIDSFGTVVLLDWELFGLGDAAYDVAGFLQMSRHELDEEGRALWLDSYLATVDQPGLAARIGVYERILPLNALAYLLHGLRQSTPEEAATIDANQPFFVATVAAAITQAAASLHLEAAVSEQEIVTLIHHVVNNAGRPA